MLKYIFIVTALFAATLNTIAQKTTKEKVSGIVKTTDGQPAECISVSLKNTTYGCITDENGHFQFDAPAGEYTLVVYSIAAHRKETPVVIKTGVSNFFPDLTIIENKNQLEEVVVTGQFTPQSLRNSLYKVRVINNQAIQQKAATDMQSLLNTEIGVRITNDIALGENKFELMGMGGNNIKILVDGVPLVDRGATKQSLSQIDINTIEQIEIIEGPMSVIYGTDALAGVVNVITKKARVVPEKNTYSVSARVQEETIGDEYEAFSGEGIHNESLNLNWGSKTGIYLDGAYSRNVTGGWRGDEVGRARTWAPKDQFYYDGTAGYKKKNLNVWYRLSYLDETTFKPENPKTETSNEIVDVDYLVDRYTHNMQADWKISNRLGVNVVSSYQDYKRRTRTIVSDLESGEKWLSTDESAQDVSKFQGAFMRATATWKATSAIDLQPGVEYNWDKGSGGRILGKPDISTFAAFLSAEWCATEWFSIRPGVRSIIVADYDAPVAIPSVSTKFSLNPDMDLRLSYAYGFRAPTLQELYFSFHNANHDIEGNPDLKAEYSNNFTGSYTWRIFHNENIRLTSTLSAFYNDFQDRIETAYESENSTKTTYKNISKYKTTGGTFENALIWKNLQANIGFSLVGRYNNLQDNEDVAAENKDMPDFRFSPELSASITYHITKSKTNLNLFYKYTGSRDEYQYDSTTKELYLGGVGSFNWADFTISQRAGKYLNINAGVKNIFDITTVRNTTGGSGHDVSGPSTLKGCGRSYFIGLSFLFNK
ncbi:MAG: TonB-dependent receptor [Prevotella sp.]|jgi:outer membrane receptor for ferrienterochelin and colicins|nr:TonB-dependent receptor [Prevotella sp.]